MRFARNLILAVSLTLALFVDFSQFGQILFKEWWVREVAWSQVQARVVKVKPMSRDDRFILLIYEYSAGASKYPGDIRVEKGNRRDGHSMCQVGDIVPVLYDPRDPAKHRIGLAEGMELNMFRGLAAVVIAPNLVALCLILYSLWRRRPRSRRELEDGIGFEH